MSTTTTGRMIATATALLLTMGARGGCQPPEKETGRAVGKAPAERACEKAPSATDIDISGRVAPDAWTDPDGPSCLEIKTKGGIRQVRVSRRVFNRCQTGDRYPRCARGAR